MADPNDPQILRLASRIGEQVETEADLSLAEECLDAAWEWVRVHGDNLDWDFVDPATPGIAKSIALSAAARCYANPSGFVSERGDSVTFTRFDDFAKGAELTRAEISALKKISKQGGRIVSLRVDNPDQFMSRGKKPRTAIYPHTVRVGDPYFRPVTIYTLEP